MADKNDEELTAEWLAAQAEVYSAHLSVRSASQNETNARNHLNEVKRLEAEAWKALEAHRVKVVDGRA